MAWHGTVLPEFVARLFGVSVAIAAVVWGSQLIRAQWRPGLAVLLAVWAIPIAIYHGQYSKEVFAIACVAAMLRMSVSPVGIALAAVLAIAYAVVFRSYWVVTIILWLTLLAGWRMGLGWPSRLVLMLVATLPLSLLSEQVVGFWLSDGRTVAVQDRDLLPDSATIFFNPLPNTSPFTDIVNTLAGWFTLLFPFYLVLLGAAQHVAFALFQFLNSTLFCASLVRCPHRAGRGIICVDLAVRGGGELVRRLHLRPGHVRAGFRLVRQTRDEPAADIHVPACLVE